MYPTDWRVCSLSDVAEKIMVGIASAATHAYCSSGIPMLRNLNIRPGYIDEQDVLQIDTEYEAIHKNKRLKAGDVLVVRTGYPGVSAVVPHKYDGAQCFTSLIVRPKKAELLADYFCQYMNSTFGERLSAAAEAGGAQKNLNAGELEKIRLHLPMIQEQRRIAQILSTWDQAISTAERLLGKSQRCTHNLMTSMLSGRLRFPGFSEKWRYVDLDAIFERVTNKNITQNTNVLTISGEHGLISQRDYFNKSVASANLSGYTLLHRHDFAYNKSYSAGYPMGAIKPLLAYDAGVVSSLYLCFRLRSGVDADFDFFRHYFEAGLLNQEIEGIAQEGARNHGLLNVSVIDFFNLKLHIPSAPEQRRIAEVINIARAEEEQLKAQLQALRQEKSALMSQLLTGKRRVKLPVIETEVLA